LAAAVAVGLEFGIEETPIKRGVQAVQSFPGRMRVLQGKKECMLIDDTYNASPFAAKAALEALYEIQGRPRFAVLGSMNELGDYSEQAHKEIGAMCYKDKLTAVVTIGKMANDWLAMVAGQNGVPVMRFESPYAAGWWLAENAPRHAAILFKGSQNGVFAEEAVKIMLEDKADASLLVRQSDAWLDVKKQSFVDAS
jgi:UDP-N-acetylmuramoyl-tripeptide--D-alanyl-D-alanine ligase